MTAQPKKYLFTATVDPDPLGISQSHKPWVRGWVAARHKWDRVLESPYCVANEAICAELGRYIGLPIPPYAITRTFQGEFIDRDLVSSLDFNWGQRNPSPVEADYCLQHLPQVCAGIVVFDVFIANADRHDENLAVDRTESPRDMRVYDHDGALFGNLSGEGIKRLNELQSRLGITAGPVTKGNRHVFLDAIDSNEHFDFWIQRIQEIPHGYIERVCNRARDFGISQEEAERAHLFLYRRKLDLRGLLNRHWKEFPNVKNWPLL